MVFGNAAVTKWGFGTNVTQAGAALQVGTFGTANGNGAYLTTGGAWTNNSSIHFKEDFSTLDKKQILDKISSLTISRWRYKGTANEYHIGPVAEEFYKAFSVGTDDQHLSTIDPSGIALAGIQELYDRAKEQQAIIEKQQKQIDDLLKRIEVLEKK